jgi:hypothetical protein
MRSRISRLSASIWVSPGPAEEAEAAALPFEVGPGAHEAARLIVEVRKLDLQTPFRGRRPLPEYLQDQSRPVDHLGFDRRFQVALLDGSDRRIDDDQLGLGLLSRRGDAFHLARSEQGRGLGRAHLERQPVGDVEADRFSQPGGFFETGSGVAASCGSKLRKRDDGASTAAEFALISLI